MTRGDSHNLNGSILMSGHLQLKVKNIHLSFGGVTAIAGVSPDVNPGEIVAPTAPMGANFS